MNTKFISSPAKAEGSAHAGGTKEKQKILISLSGQTSPLPAGCVCGPGSSAHLPANSGHRKPHLPRPERRPLPAPGLPWAPEERPPCRVCCCWTR